MSSLPHALRAAPRVAPRLRFFSPSPGSGSGSARAASSAATRAIRIGCASGFWGDTATSVPQLIHSGNLDFLVFDYLSEITMSLLTAAKKARRLCNIKVTLGYAPDFVHVALAPFINDIHRKRIRVVSNAGGVNPLACAEAIQEVIKKAGLDLKVAVVTGDDLMPHRSRLSEFGWKSDEYDLLAAGSLAGHLIECGAQSTGGIFTDWHKVPDWDNMGFPVVECSSDGSFVLSKPPKTGGLVSFGTAAEQLVYEIGDPRRYLLPDVTCDFSQVLIKEVPDLDVPTLQTAASSQLLIHEKLDRRPTFVSLCGRRCCQGDGMREASLRHPTTRCAPPTWTVSGRRPFVLSGGRELQKRPDRRQTQHHQTLRQRSGALGAEDTYMAPNARNKGSREAVIWMAVHHKQKKALELFSREVAPAGTGMGTSATPAFHFLFTANATSPPPGLTGIVGGRPRVSPVLKPFFFLQPKSELTVDLHVGGELVESFAEAGPDAPEQEAPPTSAEDLPDAELPSGPHSYRLEELAFTRSGDKGDSANIGVIARHPLFFPYLKKHLTSSVVEEYFSHLIWPGVNDAVTRNKSKNNTEDKDQLFCRITKYFEGAGRYTLPGIHALNFVLQSSLGGGGVASLRSDPQGKAFGQMLLDLKLKGLPDLKSLVD
ncbi:hypothetical protein L3Q82_016473 [Scortum barcoo]|uniref:Uncharacterized protein n=1 Tax=Scortum barcoo TaxID=214431 RepID=A0ACB8X9E9_9TELE|nr:hypothetical protein L3Q82_016473 [Scortum barcoo]